jgi:hypothetical protein
MFVVALVAGAFAASTGLSQTAAPGTRLPDPVAKAFETAFPKGKILKVDAEEEDGVTVYDFEFKDGAIEKETDITADGTMLEFTVVVVPKAVPAPAMKAIRAAAKGAKIARLEHIEISSETQDGKVVKLPETVTHYAAELTKGKLHGEIVVLPGGAVVDSPKWVEEKPADKTGK